MVSKCLWETVYFLRQGALVKIGHTISTVERRMKSYATHASTETELLGFTHGDRHDERRFHGRFSLHRERGEWFRLEGDLAVFIERELPLHQERTERLRMSDLRAGMSAATPKVPRKVPREAAIGSKRRGRKLIAKGGKIFNTQGKRVLALKAGDYFVEG